MLKENKKGNQIWISWLKSPIKESGWSQWSWGSTFIVDLNKFNIRTSDFKHVSASKDARKMCNVVNGISSNIGIEKDVWGFAFNTNHTQNTRKKYFFLFLQFEPGHICDRLQCQYKYAVLALLLLMF